MTKFNVLAKPTIIYGFTVDNEFYEWEVLETLREQDYYYFMEGSQKAEPLVKAGLATWSASGDGAIRGTEEAETLYMALHPEINKLIEANQKASL